MKLGEIVANEYRKQYFKRKTGSWLNFTNWEIQPEQIDLILRELESKEAIDALMGNDSWTKTRTKKDGIIRSALLAEGKEA